MKNGIKAVGRRAIKKRLLSILENEPIETALKALKKEPLSDVLNHLFSFLYHTDENIKWAAVSAMGLLVSELADKDMASSRVILRRLMWNLNDESGGIGWGAPEAIGEILAKSKRLSEEFAHVLVSYTREDGNFLEYEMLQQGLLWGIFRMVESGNRVDLVDALLIIPYLDSSDALVRGMAALILGLLEDKRCIPKLERLTHDTNAIRVYRDQKISSLKVLDLAEEALDHIRQKKDLQFG